MSTSQRIVDVAAALRWDLDPESVAFTISTLRLVGRAPTTATRKQILRFVTTLLWRQNTSGEITLADLEQRVEARFGHAAFARHRADVCKELDSWGRAPPFGAKRICGFESFVPAGVAPLCEIARPACCARRWAHLGLIFARRGSCHAPQCTRIDRPKQRADPHTRARAHWFVPNDARPTPRASRVPLASWAPTAALIDEFAHERLDHLQGVHTSLSGDSNTFRIDGDGAHVQSSRTEACRAPPCRALRPTPRPPRHAPASRVSAAEIPTGCGAWNGTDPSSQSKEHRTLPRRPL